MKNIVVDRKERPIEIFSSMGCRTSNAVDVNFMQVFKANIQKLLHNDFNLINMFSASQKDGRGNICPVTIILPTLAMESKLKVEKKYTNENGELVIEDHQKFQNEVIHEFLDKMLPKKIDEAKDMLIERFEHICAQPASSAKFMWENNTMCGYVPEEGTVSALKHGTLAIGQIGLAETLQILIGKDQTTDEGMELGKQIEQLYKNKCNEFKKEYKLNFGVYYTPAENLCYTSMKKFKSKYGIIPKVSDREYFTNSVHVPVWIDVDPFKKIDIESQLSGYETAGGITYVEMPSSGKHNIDAVETIVNYAMNHDIPYFALNFCIDRCIDCNYQDEIGEKCPQCGGTNISRLRRVTGYLTGNYKTAFNKGKQEEVEQRVKHIKH